MKTGRPKGSKKKDTDIINCEFCKCESMRKDLYGGRFCTECNRQLIYIRKFFTRINEDEAKTQNKRLIFDEIKWMLERTQLLTKLLDMPAMGAHKAFKRIIQDNSVSVKPKAKPEDSYNQEYRSTKK